MKSYKLLIFTLVFILISSVSESATFFTADVDLRYRTDFKDSDFKVEAIGLSARRVFADRMGDRIILFGLLDAMDNFREIMIDQAYIQYKGPLGRWNITAGRYILPFGLLPNYRTKRLIIKTLEYETIGIGTDNGILLSGVIRDFDYALSLSQGVGSQRWTDIDDEVLLVFRVGHQGPDVEDVRVGLSGAMGRVLPKKGHNAMPHSALDKRLLAIDLIKYHGAQIYRAEVTFGEEEQKPLFGAFAGIDWAILPRVELNVGSAYLNKHNNETGSVTVGLTYNIYGTQIRAAQKLSLIGEEKNELSLQVYRIFNF